MGWYAAHAIIYTKFKNGNQDKYPIMENIYLIKAESIDEALKKAIARGKEDEGDASGTYYYEDRPATHILAGIRKIIRCEDVDERPTDGTEISYSQMVVTDEELFNKLISGEAVEILYEE